MKTNTITLTNAKLYTPKSQKHRKIKQTPYHIENISTAIATALLILIFSTLTAFTVSTALHPEKYSPTFVYQLKNDVAMNNQQAIAYMNRNK